MILHSKFPSTFRLLLKIHFKIPVLGTAYLNCILSPSLFEDNIVIPKMSHQFRNSSKDTLEEIGRCEVEPQCCIACQKSQRHSEDILFQNKYRGISNINGRRTFHPEIQRKNRSPIQNGNSTINSKGFVSIFLKGSSVHALKKIGNSKSTLRRAIWTLIVFIGLVSCSVQIGQFLVSYYTYPVVVNIFSVRTHRQEFPAITICNINKVPKEFLNCIHKMLSYSDCMTSNKEVDEIEEDRTVPFAGNASEDAYEESFDYFGNGTDFEGSFMSDRLASQTYKSRVAYGHQAEDFIRSCSYNGNECCSSEFTPSVSWSYGNCYTLNVTNSSYFENDGYYKIGPESGLELILNLEIEKYLPFTEDVGARIHVHDFHQPHDVDRHGVNLLPGHKTSIAISKHVTKRLPPPFPDNCYLYEAGDSEWICQEGCEARHIYSMCSCTYTDYHNQDQRVCDFMNPLIYCCVDRAYETVKCNCPTACKEVTYNLQMSSTRWPTEAAYNDTFYSFGEEEESFNTYKDFRETYLKVKVFYDTMDFTTTKQSPQFHDSEFLSLVGGQLGLWLGLSIITIFEFIENLLVLCRRKVSGRKEA